MFDLFRITQRHYNLIIKQAQANYPKESGGFIGGLDGEIKAVLPTHNLHLYDKTATFQITNEDIERAHLFFKKHKVEYFCVYHTHPNGAPYPSKADIDTGQKYHFIVGLADPENPVVNAYAIVGKQVIPIPIRIVADTSYSVVDIHAKADGSGKKKAAGELGDIFQEAAELTRLLEDMKNESLTYKKLDPKTGFDSSDFSTFA